MTSFLEKDKAIRDRHIVDSSWLIVDNNFRTRYLLLYNVYIDMKTVLQMRCDLKRANYKDISVSAQTLARQCIAMYHKCIH